MLRFIKKNKFSDTMISLIIFVVFVLILFNSKDLSDLLDVFKDLNSVMITIWATMLGFLITSVSVLLTIKDSKYILALKKTGHFKKILEIFVTTCFVMGILLLSSIVLFINFNLIFLYVYMYISIYGFVKIFSCLRILLKIIDLTED